MHLFNNGDLKEKMESLTLHQAERVFLKMDGIVINVFKWEDIWRVYSACLTYKWNGEVVALHVLKYSPQQPPSTSLFAVVFQEYLENYSCPYLI